jgi:hypothetical protein
MKNCDCPVCDPWLCKLAEEVPFSHHVNSTIVCRLSGKIMDEDNAPMAFPNGYVYSREVRTAIDNPFPSPFSALNLVYFILLITWNNGSGFRRDVGAARGKSQVSAHSGRVRVLQVEKGIHILILAFLLYSTARHCTIAFLPHCTCMIHSLRTLSFTQAITKHHPPGTLDGISKPPTCVMEPKFPVCDSTRHFSDRGSNEGDESD